jgi:hypothetical protein
MNGRPRVFGVGWAKTGTTTLGGCMRLLGYDHCGQNLSLVPEIARGDLSRTMRIANRHGSFSDWPWIILFRELDAAFPGSRFILTTRDPDRWVESYLAMIAREGTPSPALSEIRSYLYGMDVGSAPPTALKDRVLRHQDEVTAHFHGRPGDLLVVDWERGDRWITLCGFLGIACPSDPFPHLNRRPGATG